MTSVRDIVSSVAEDSAELPVPEPENPGQGAGDDGYVTVEAARLALEEEKARVRERVLREADHHGWCDDGTRKVLAELRLRRPDRKTEHVVELPVTLTLRFELHTYCAAGAVDYVSRNILPLDGYAQSVTGRLTLGDGQAFAGGRIRGASLTGPWTVDGQPVAEPTPGEDGDTSAA